jgi:hypothetical protein
MQNDDTSIMFQNLSYFSLCLKCWKLYLHPADVFIILSNSYWRWKLVTWRVGGEDE